MNKFEQGPILAPANPEGSGGGGMERRLAKDIAAQVKEVLKAGRYIAIDSVNKEGTVEEKSLPGGQGVLGLYPINGGYHLCKLLPAQYRAYRAYFADVEKDGRKIKLGQALKAAVPNIISIESFGSSDYAGAKATMDAKLQELGVAA